MPDVGFTKLDTLRRAAREEDLVCDCVFVSVVHVNVQYITYMYLYKFLFCVGPLNFIVFSSLFDRPTSTQTLPLHFHSNPAPCTSHQSLMLGEARELLYTQEGERKDGLTMQPVLDAAEEYHTRLVNMAKEVCV